MPNLFQILNQFEVLFRKNVIEKSFINWRVLRLVKINTRILDTPVSSTLREPRCARMFLSTTGVSIVPETSDAPRRFLVSCVHLNLFSKRR
jgi:hypothetical protein